MKKTTNLKQELMVFLEKRLTPHEFQRSHQLFYRKTSTGKQILHVSIIRRKSYIDIVPSVEIRHNEIERLYHLLLGELPNLQTATIGCELGNLSGNGTKMLTIRELSDVPIAGEEILKTFWDVGQSFFVKYSSLERIFDVLIRDGKTAKIYCPLPDVRAKKTLIAAYLLNRKNIYDDLVDKKIIYLNTIDISYAIDFLQFAVKLKKLFSSL